MNRPKYKHIRMKGKDTTYLLNHILAYRLELEKYCDELEKREQPMIVHKKKVDRTEIKVGNGIFKLDYMWVCPNCENWISPSHDEKYCSHCGQRIEYE